MEVTVVRLSRPLLLDFDKSYQTIYGFVIEDDDSLNPCSIYDYVGYLAGLHCISNGDNYFTISYDLRGVPDWVDKRGKTHIKQDAWICSTQEKCIKKLNLTYDTITLDVDEDELYRIINEENLIVDKNFYNDLKEYLSSSESEQPLWEDDDLPF